MWAYFKYKLLRFYLTLSNGNKMLHCFMKKKMNIFPEYLAVVLNYMQMSHYYYMAYFTEWLVICMCTLRA